MDALLCGDGSQLDDRIKELCTSFLNKTFDLATKPDVRTQRIIFEYECHRIASFARRSRERTDLGAVYGAIGQLVSGSDLWQVVPPPTPVLMPCLSDPARSPSARAMHAGGR